MGKKIKVFAPASVSNVGCGFDILGFSIDGHGDEITLEQRTDDKLVIKHIEGAVDIPLNPEINTASVAVRSLLKANGLNVGFDISIKKNITPGSGLGSSASSSVGAVFAANELLNLAIKKEDLLIHTMEGERAATGKVHADNVAPSMLGGFTVVRGYDPLDIFQLPFPEELRVVVIYPQIQIKTSEARKILPAEIPLENAVAQWGNVAGLIAGLTMKDLSLIKRSLKDEIVEPVRKKLIPHYDQIKDACLDSGALGFNISGSGPAMFALMDDETLATQLVKKMETFYSEISQDARIFTSAISMKGAMVL